MTILYFLNNKKRLNIVLYTALYSIIPYTTVIAHIKMNKVKELKIDNTLWGTPARIINLINFNPEKINY